MRNVEYQGYGVDFADFVPLVVNAGCSDTADRLRELVSDMYEVEPGTGEVSVYGPTNTDGFGCLFLIDAIVPVSDNAAPIKTYTISEANNTLQIAIARFLESGVDEGYITADDYDVVRGIVANNIAGFAGYSWDNNWTDCI